MSNDSGDGNTQNGQSADQAYKSFSSEDEFTSFQSKTFSSGYNDMKAKAIAKIGDALGEEVGDLDSALDKVKSYKQKVAQSVSDPTATEEYKALQNTVKEYEAKVQEAQQTAQQVKNQYKIDSTFNNAVSSLKEVNKFKIPEGDVKDLFLARHKVEFKDGREVVRSGEELVIDDQGNPKSLEKAFIDFSKGYTEPATDGAGGGSGDGGGAKPKFADFKAAKNNHAEQAKLLSQAKNAGGWAEADAPAV